MGIPDNNAEPLYSSEKHGRWLWLGMALAFLLLPSPAVLAIPEELAKGNYAILAALLFPVAATWMGWMAWQSFREWSRFGATPLYPDPAPGCAGGQVGGSVMIPRSSGPGEFRATLQCVHVRISGSGKRRNRNETVRWQENQPTFVEPFNSGLRVRFVFDVPGDLPASSEKDRDYHLWRLSLNGRCAGVTLTRQFELPVVQGTDQAGEPLPQAERRRMQTSERARRLEEAQSQIQVTPVAGGLELYSAAGRNLHLAVTLVVMGFLFSGAAGFMISAGDAPVLLPLAFTLFGVPMILGGIISAGRSLRVRIADGRIHQVRYVLGYPVWRRAGELTCASQLDLRKGGSVNKAGETVIFYHLQARVGERSLRVAEGLRGRQLAETFRDAVARMAHLRQD
jgi:hypothetical protein